MTKRPPHHPRVLGLKTAQPTQQQMQKPVRQRRLMVLSPVHYDATSWYRAGGPFSCMRSPFWEIDIVKKDQPIDWTDVMRADVVFIQRPYNDEHWEFAQVCHSLGRPIWIDYDDFLFDVPPSNGAHAVYADKRTQETMGKIIGLASAITVSTNELALQLHQRYPTKNFIVCPNTWNDAVHRFEKKPWKPHKRFIWRGSHTHKEDIDEHLEGIYETAQHYPDYEWWFVGDVNYKINKIIPAAKLIQVQPLQTVKYFNFLKVAEASIGIVPLADNMFNQCKSNIAWQELTMAGCAVVAPDWEEWTKEIASWPIVSQYGFDDSRRTFKEACINAVENGEALYNNAWEYLQKHLMLSQMNRLRREIMNRLTDVP